MKRSQERSCRPSTAAWLHILGRLRSMPGWGLPAPLVLALMSAPATARGTPPRDSFKTDITTVTLMLLDVEVTDRKGNPIRGLRKEDFTVRLDGRAWPIESVDDMCPCEASRGPRKLHSAPMAPALDLAGSTSMRDAEPVQVVLYMDFSQLQMDGRQRAVKEAKRWVTEVMRQDDRVMIAGYATAAGLGVLCPFTNDRSKLIAALDAAYDNPALNDPFPTLYLTRLQECIRDPWICALHAADEYHHGRRSLETFENFLAGLDPVPGRKQLILFSQNGNIHPGSLYGSHTWNHVRRLEDVAAEATTSSVTIHPITFYDTLSLDPMSSETKEFGFDLADATGGTHNRGPSDLSRILDEVRLRCACVYRIGLVPPPVKARKLHRLSVNVRGRTLPHDYVTQSLTEMDRWLRQARAVLANPAGARDLRIASALVPVRADAGKWEVRAQVALDLDSLTILPTGTGSRGTWEVGAALARTDGAGSWEMLGISQVRSGRGIGSEVWVVHERRFSALKPGSYRMVSFVRDRTANVFGGAESSIILPRPGREGFAGPVLMRSSRRQVVANLPLLKDAEPGKDPQHGATVVTGPVAAGDLQAGPREPLEVMTWVCGRAGAASPAPPFRYIAEEGTPILRFEAGLPEPAGQCSRITDRIEGWQPRPGSYSYHLRWPPQEKGEAPSAEVAFEIAGSAPETAIH